MPLGGLGVQDREPLAFSVRQIQRPDPTFVERWIRNPRALLGYSLVLGSALASWNWINALIGGGLRSLTGTAGLLLALAYYTLAGVAGVRLLARKPGADQLAILALLPQLVQIQTGSFLVKIVCGLSIGLLVGGNGVSFSFGAESALAVSIGQTERPTVAFLNLAAAAFLWYFYHQADVSNRDDR